MLTDLVQTDVEAKIEAATNYLHLGEINLARSSFLELQDLELSKDDRIRVLLGLVKAEWYADNILLSHEYILQATELAKNISDNELLGLFHSNYGLILRRLADVTERTDYLDKSIMEYTAASFYYELSGNVNYQARVENNLAFLQLSLTRYEQALVHAGLAKDLIQRSGEPSQLSYIYDTIARIHFAAGHFEYAYEAIQNALRLLPESYETKPYLDVSSTLARILFRLSKFAEGKKVLEDAILIAEKLEQFSVLGELYLNLLEEGEPSLLPNEIISIYQKVFLLLNTAKDKGRLAAIANKFFAILSPLGESTHIDNICDRLEKETIKRALINADGSVSRAANSIGVSHQRIDSSLNTRFRDLLSARTPRIPRKKSIIKKR